jgi:murein DD-endopeptidase MepM/ murein hydrolase activator NlpD
MAVAIAGVGLLGGWGVPAAANREHSHLSALSSDGKGMNRSTHSRLSSLPLGNSRQELPTVPYTVGEGDTIESLARRFGFSPQLLRDVNPKRNFAKLQAGQKIHLPKTPSVMTDKRYKTGGTEWQQVALLSPPSPSTFIWPMPGPITSGFGWRWGRPHEGIDISGSYGAPIAAAISGRVVYAGWDVGGYGYRVDILSDDGILTRYAHGSSVLVAEGQQVQQGNIVMTCGATGHAYGPHLHFEVRVNDSPTDPLTYFDSQTAMEQGGDRAIASYVSQ